MRLLIVYQFYLTYVLPRDGNWNNKQFGFELENSFISVRPKNIDEDLFPNDIDRTLSGMAVYLKKLNFKTTVLKREVKDIVIDRVEVQIRQTINDINLLKDKIFQEKKLAEAVKCCNIFLKHCRVLSMNPFLRLLPREYSVRDKRYYNLFPFTVAYLNEDNLAMKIDVVNGVNAMASPGAIRSPESGSIDVRNILRAVEPDLYNSFVVDALEMISTGRIKESILLLVICCEIKVKKAFVDKGITRSQLERMKVSNLSFVDNYFDLLPRKFIGKSLRNENKQIFESIKNLYKTRNNIVHEGKCIYLDNGNEINVDEIISSKFLDATRVTLKWIDTTFR